MTPDPQTDVMADSARLREESAAAEYTIAQAIDDALFYRRQPELIVDPRKAKKVIDTLLSAIERSRCYFNAARRGQETFVLVQQDRAAPLAIQAWARAAAEHGAKDKAYSAVATALKWSKQPLDTTKWPD